MLRLKQVMNECGIPQKLLVEATGFGKSQISQTLSTGKLPADVDKFRKGVARLIEGNDCLVEHMKMTYMEIDDLLETVSEQAAPAVPPLFAMREELYRIVGSAVLLRQPVELDQLIRMADTILYLRGTLGNLVGPDAPFTLNTETEAFKILTGG